MQIERQSLSCSKEDMQANKEVLYSYQAIFEIFSKLAEISTIKIAIFYLTFSYRKGKVN